MQQHQQPVMNQQTQVMNQQPQVQVPLSKNGVPLEDLIEKLAISSSNMQESMNQFRQETRASINSLSNQITQLATNVNELNTSKGGLPSQVQVNPRENVSSMTVLSGEQLEEPSLKVVEEVPRQKETKEESSKPHKSKVSNTSNQLNSKIVIPPHFPCRFAKGRKFDDEDVNDMLTIFQNIHINIPFLDAIRKMPKCAKFLKDFMARKIQQDKEAKVVGEQVLAMIQHKLPKKCKDLGMFVIPCMI